MTWWEAADGGLQREGERQRRVLVEGQRRVGGDEGLGLARGGLAVHGDGDHLRPLGPLRLLEGGQRRHLLLARRAPRRPQVQEHDAPLEGSEGDGLARGVAEGGGRRRRALAAGDERRDLVQVRLGHRLRVRARQQRPGAAALARSPAHHLGGFEHRAAGDV